MGHILAMPDTAEPFAAETRRESFYVNTGPDNLVLEARRLGDLHGAVSVPMDQVSALLSALQVVQLDGRYAAWKDGDGLRRDDIRPDSPAVDWTVTRQDDRLVVTGRVIAFVGDGDWVLSQSIELCYRDLSDPAQALAAVRG